MTRRRCTTLGIGSICVTATLAMQPLAHAQEAGTCTVERTTVQGPMLGGDLIGAASRFGIVIAGERRTKLVLSRLDEARIRDLRRHNIGLGPQTLVRAYAGSPDGPAVIGLLDPRPGPRRRRPGIPTLVRVGEDGLLAPLRVRGMRSLADSALAVTTDGRRIALVTTGPGQRTGALAALTMPEPSAAPASTAATDAIAQIALLPGRIAGTPALAWLGDRVAIAIASSDGGFGFVRLGIWTPGQPDAIEFRDVAPWRGEPPGNMQLGASPEGFVLAWDIDEREGNVATTMVFVPNDATVPATTLPAPWFGRAIARSSNGPWVTVAHAEGNGALHVRVARGDEVADGVLRIEGAREIVQAVVVPDGRGGARGVAVGADGTRTRFTASCRLSAPSRSGVASAGSIAPEGERFPSLLGDAGTCAPTPSATLAVRDAAPGALGRWITSAASGTHIVGVALDAARGAPAGSTAGSVRLVVVDTSTEGASARSLAWPFAVAPHGDLVAIDDAGDGAFAIGWVGPRQTIDEPAPGPPAGRPVTRRIEAHSVFLGWIALDGTTRGEPIEVAPLRAAEPRDVIVAAATERRAAISVLDRAERARTRIAVVRDGAVARVVPLGRRVDSGLGIGWSNESIAAAWAAGNATGSGYVHVLRWPQSGGSRPRWWIGGAWEGMRPMEIVVAADTSGTNVGWIDRAPSETQGVAATAATQPTTAASPSDRTLAIVRVPLADRAPSSRRPVLRARAVSLSRGPGGIAASYFAEGRVRVRVVRQGSVAASDAVAPPATDPQRVTTAVTTDGAMLLGASEPGVGALRLACTPTEARSP